MNFKTTILLFIALVIVGGIFFFSQSTPRPAAQDQTPDQASADQGKKLFDLTADQVNGVTITDADGNRTVLTRQGATWRMTQPVDSPAVDWQATDLVRTLCDLRTHGAPAAAPADSGLDQPRFSVDLSTTDGKTVHLGIGSKNNLGDMMYAQADGGDVNLIDASLAKTLTTAADDLRDKHLLTTPVSDIKQVRISTPTSTLEMEKVGDTWKITQPVQIPGDADAISSLLSSITGIEAGEFIKSDSPELMLARFDYPTMQVWISSQPPSTQPSSQPSEGQMLTIGAADITKEHYLAETSAGLTVKIDKAAMDGLQKTPLDLRDKNVVAVPPGDVIRVSELKETFPTTTANAQSEGELKPVSSQLVTLLRRPPAAPKPFGPVPKAGTAPSTEPAQTVWMFSTDAKSPVDDSKVDALLEKFNPLHADKYLQKPPVEPWQNRYLVTIQGKSASYDIQLFRPANGLTPYAIYNGLTFELPTPALDALDADFHKVP